MFYEWAANPKNLPNVTVKVSSVEEYNAMDIYLESRFKNAKCIPNTQKIHCVIPGKDGTVYSKRFSNSTVVESHKIIKKCK